jgi:two-component SAPR family response regulator
MDIKEILKLEGYKVIFNVPSVDKAITIIEEINPILVLIDINLKEIKDGIKLAEFLLIKGKIPFIYLTSYACILAFVDAKLLTHG